MAKTDYYGQRGAIWPSGDGPISSPHTPLVFDVTLMGLITVFEVIYAILKMTNSIGGCLRYESLNIQINKLMQDHC